MGQYIKNPAKEQHKRIDAKYKRLAKSYRHSASLLMTKIRVLESTYAAAPSDNRTEIAEELRLLRQMYRTTKEIGREAEHYYERGWWRSEIYTVNSR